MKTTFVIPYLLVLAVLLGFTSCDRWKDGPYSEDKAEFGVTNFDAVEAGHAIRITILRGSDYQIKAQGHQSDIEDLNVRKINQTLKVSFAHPNRRSNYPLELTIVMPALHKVDFSGAVKAEVSGFSKAEELSINLSGASDMYFEGDNAYTRVNLSGASRLELEGYTDRFQAELSGASNLQSFNFPTYRGDYDLSGASNARVTVSEKLYAEASGASSLRYRGNPRTTLYSSGGSSIRKD